MRQLLVVFFLCVWANLALAAGPDLSLGPGEVLRGHFQEQHVMKGTAKPVLSEGHFVLAPDYGLIWALERPIPYSFVITSAGMTQFLGGVPLFFEPPAKAAMFLHLLTMVLDVFSGQWHELDKDFSTTRSGDSRGWMLKLVSRSSSEASRAVKDLVVRGERFVDSAEVTEAGGSTDKVTFSAQQIAKGKPSDQELALFNQVGQ